MKRKGLTLVELIIALTLGVMVMGIGVQLLFGATNNSVFATKEKRLQDANRIFLSYTDNAIKYSTATFTIADSTFNTPNNEKLTPDWNYIGLKKNITIPGKMTQSGKDLDVKTALVAIDYKKKKPDESKLKEDETLITIKDGGAEHYFVQKIIAFSDLSNGKEFLYDLRFFKPVITGSKASRENNSLNYEMKLTLSDGTSQTIDYGTIESKLSSLNALQVIDRGSPSDPAVAIAYRTDNVYLQKEGAHGVISLILDNSISMRYDMAGKNNLGDSHSESRISILREETNKLLKILSVNKAADVELVPFARRVLLIKSDGGDEKPIFHSASQEYWEKTINSKVVKGKLKEAVDGLKTSSHTNTGEGLRYAFYSIDEKNKELLHKNPDKPFQNYLIILVDGDSNTASVIPTLEGNYIYRSKYNSHKKGNTNRKYCSKGHSYFLKKKQNFSVEEFKDVLDDSFVFEKPNEGKYSIVSGTAKPKINLIAPTTTHYDPQTQDLSSDYTHILVNGNTKEESIQDAYESTYRANSYIRAGSGYKIGNAYVSQVGKLYKNPNIYLKNSPQESRQAIQDMVNGKRVYLIAFGKDVSSSGLNTIADVFSIRGDSKRVFIAGSSEDLTKIFEDIGESINNDLWMVNGPKW